MTTYKIIILEIRSDYTRRLKKSLNHYRCDLNYTEQELIVSMLFKIHLERQVPELDLKLNKLQTKILKLIGEDYIKSLKEHGITNAGKYIPVMQSEDLVYLVTPAYLTELLLKEDKHYARPTTKH